MRRKVQKKKLVTIIALILGCAALMALSRIASPAEFPDEIMGIDLMIVPLVAIGLAVLTYNTALFAAFNSEDRTLALVQRIAWGQIILDWLAMLALVHFTGGITSPALPYFFIHAALSGTILVPWQARSLALEAGDL